MDQEEPVLTSDQSSDLNNPPRSNTVDSNTRSMVDNNLVSSPSSTSTPPPDSASLEGSILFAETSTVDHSKLKRRGPLMESRISNTLGTLGESMRKMTNAANTRLAEKLLNSTETFGNFIMWMPEPSLPSRYSGSIEMPSREIQMALIDHYFNERHESIGMLIKFYFYEQLETKGLLITPLLLNIIYAHAARFVNIPNCPKTEVFYHRARRLVDDFLDVPRVSTIVALCLLSLYEASPAIYRPGSYHCRQWQYSGMACRMSLELGLYDDSNIHSSISPVEIELRRRVFWGCYDLDKFQSGGWERPWMISHTFIRTRPPCPLPEESEDDALMIDVVNSKLTFVSIVEENLILLTASQAFLGGNNGKDMFLGIHKDNMLAGINENHTKHQQWLRTLKPHMQWTPNSILSVKDVLDLPAPRAMIGHLHLYYNAICLALLNRLPTSSVVKFQSRVTAACMTQLAYHLCQSPQKIIKFDFVAHVLIAAIKVHLRYLDDADVNLAQQAWLLFDRSIWCMQLINGIAVIPNCAKFLQQVQNIYGLHMGTDNTHNSQANFLPKKKQKSSDIPTKQNTNLDSQSTSHHRKSHLQPSMSNDLSSNNNKIIVNDVHFTDDINQILTDWNSPSHTSANESDCVKNSNNILHIDNENNRNSMVYLSSHNTQLHPQYHQFNTTSVTTAPHRTTTDISQHSFPSQYINHNTSHSNPNQPVWSSNPTYDTRNRGNHSIQQYDDREIIVPSQLGEGSSSDHSNPALFQHQPLTNNSSRFDSSDESSLWPQETTSIIDSQDPGIL